MVGVERPSLENLQVPEDVSSGLGKNSCNYGRWYEDITAGGMNQVAEVKRGLAAAKPTTSDECFYGPVMLEPKEPNEEVLGISDNYQPVMSRMDAVPWHVEVENSKVGTLWIRCFIFM